MLGAIDRSISFSKSSQGIGLSPHNTSFDILAALNNPIKWMKTVLPADGRKRILLDPLPEGLKTIISDKLWFEENLFCLLSNADKYSSKGTIRVTLSIEKKNIRVAVEDSGIGISPEFKALLFKQFSKVQKMAAGSTGLGLFSLLKRSEAIGGLCGFQNRGDGAQGSVFWFEIPHLGCSETLDLIPAKLNSEQKSLFILVVDDSAVVTKCLMNKLMGGGHRVEIACNGADALEKMVELAGQLDVVFMDMQMPVMDGLEATRRYRMFEMKSGAMKRLPIICSSANSGDGSAACATAAGMDSFLSKPFSAEKLTLALAAIGGN
jgi:two-component system, sensor histidine kinase